MAMTRRRFVLSSLGSAIAAPRLFSTTASPLGGPISRRSGSGEGTKPYGSSHFGEWIEDEFGLPAFRYSCDQTTDPAAKTPVNPGLLGPTEHIHQAGNDRITAIVSNFGHLRVRQDEGAPKFLTDYDPATHQFGGGLGWLTDGEETLSTFYTGKEPELDRIFGSGYFRKSVAGKRLSVEQTIFAPFGDDPVLISQATIANRGDEAMSVRWVEYWGCQSYEFSFRDFIVSLTGAATMPELRRRAGERCTHSVHRAEGGLVETREFPGHTPEEDAAWQRMREALRTHPNGFISAVPEPRAGTWYESNRPPATFLVPLDGRASGFSTDGAGFFGPGGPAAPDGMARPLGQNLNSTGPGTALLLERSITLQPGEKRTLSSLYGYLPEGFELKALVDHYREHQATALATSSAQWKRSGMRFEVDGEPWVERETAWNYYCLRSSMTYDDYFRRRILNQNGFYQYVVGFQGAARDPLQHCLPFLFSDAEIVRSVLRYTLSEVREDGSVPYAITGHGVVAPMASDNGSDLPLWLMWAVSEYVLATRDVDFLREKIPARVTGTGEDTVANLLARCYRHQVKDVGAGQHGLVKMLNDDWNDGLLGTWAGSDLAEAVADGESVLNSAMSAWVFDEYARMLRYAKTDAELQEELNKNADECRRAARAQWTGRWLRRAWLGPKLGWLGETTLWLEPQPWAILSEVTDAEQSRTLVAAMNELLQKVRLAPCK